MKITIIPSDQAVYKDGVSYSGLTLNTVPAEVHALQWSNNKGHIEFVDNAKANEEILELPSWANDALNLWQISYDEEQKKLEKILNNPQPTTTGTQTI